MRQDHCNTISFHFFTVFAQILSDNQLEFIFFLLFVFTVCVNYLILSYFDFEFIEYFQDHWLDDLLDVKWNSFLGQFITDSAVMDESNWLIEGYIGTKKILISVVMSYAGIFFNLIWVKLLYSFGSWKFFVSHVAVNRHSFLSINLKFLIGTDVFFIVFRFNSFESCPCELHVSRNTKSSESLNSIFYFRHWLFLHVLLHVRMFWNFFNWNSCFFIHI